MAAEFPMRPWLISGIIRELDTVLLVGTEKAGKSLITQQMICSLTSGHPFLDKYEVGRQYRVSYVQLEGEIEDTQLNFKRMLSSVDFAPEMFQLVYCNALSLEDGKDALDLIKEIQQHHKPDIVVIDPLYMAMKGGLSEDVPVRDFWGSVRKIKRTLSCAVVVIHHAHKIRFTRDGKVIEEGDNATFGSAFLKAYPDNILFLAHDKKNGMRILSCQTQRKGDIEKSIKLNLVQPDPLYFEEAEQSGTYEGNIMQLLQSGPKSIEELEEITKFSRSTLYRSIKKMGTMVSKVVNTKPIQYRLNLKGEK